jgi:hypothetical protein
MTHKTSISFLALLGCIFLFSCNKGEDQKTTVNGRLIEYGTRKPVADAKVFVLCDNTQLFGPIQYPSILDTLRTDADGRFFLEYTREELCGSAHLHFYKPGYQFNGFAEINLVPVNDIEAVMDPDAWFKLVTVPDLGTQHLIVGGNFMGTAGLELFASEGSQEFYYPVLGNRNLEIFWREWGQLDQTMFDTLYIGSHDTSCYTLHY